MRVAASHNGIKLQTEVRLMERVFIADLFAK